MDRLLEELSDRINGLNKTYLLKPAPTNTNELWKEHLIIRKCIEEVEKLQNRENKTTSLLDKERTAEDLDIFVKWSKDNGIKFDNVSIKHLGDEIGYGLVANTDIAGDKLVVCTPQRCIISTDTARESTWMKKEFEEDLIIKGMENVGLAIFLAGESLKTDSQWAAYINMFPRTFASPLFYTEEELQALRPSPIFEETLLFYRTIARQFCHVLLLLVLNEIYKKEKKNRQRKNVAQLPLFRKSPFTISNYTFRLYRWAVCCVSTRINLIPSQLIHSPGGRPYLVPSLIPVFDMANNKIPEDNSHVSVHYDDSLDAAVMFSSYETKTDDQVYVYYGRRSNGEYLLHNAFVPSDNNPWERYKLKIAFSPSDKLFKEKMQKMFELGVLGSQRPMSSHIFIFEVALCSDIPFPKSLEAFARLHLATSMDITALNSHELIKKSISFLKNRFFLLESSYRDVTEGRTHNEKNIEALKKSELAILTNARKYCESLEQDSALDYSNWYLEDDKKAEQPTEKPQLNEKYRDFIENTKEVQKKLKGMTVESK